MKTAVRDEFTRQKPNEIQVSGVSETVMRKIVTDSGLITVTVSALFLYYRRVFYRSSHNYFLVIQARL